MRDDDECECGDFRSQHKDGVGICYACRGGSNYTPVPNEPGPCQEFKLYEEKG